MSQLLLWADPPAPTRPATRSVPLVCPCCGETSPNDFLANLNHWIAPDGVCISASLRARHKRFDHAA